MPRADGTLYNFEKAALEPPKEKKPLGRPPKPKPVEVEREKPQAPAVPKPGRKNLAMRAYIGEEQPDLRKQLQPAQVEQVLENIRGGLSIESSLILVGINRKRMEKWRERFPALDDKFRKAEVDWERQIVGNLAKFATADSKVNQWLLERRLPARWAPVGKTELTGANGGPIAALTLSKQLLGSIAQGDPEEKVAKARRVAPIIDVESAGEKQSPAKPA